MSSSNYQRSNQKRTPSEHGLLFDTVPGDLLGGPALSERRVAHLLLVRSLIGSEKVTSVARYLRSGNFPVWSDAAEGPSAVPSPSAGCVLEINTATFPAVTLLLRRWASAEGEKPQGEPPNLPFIAGWLLVFEHFLTQQT